MIEIRWHGRGGQGAKTASQVLALASMRHGRSVQAFPEYGPERSGAPVRAYTRIDECPIRRRYAITSPDLVAVLDPSLLRESEVTAGLRETAALLVNSEREPSEVAAELGFAGRVVCIPAAAIAAARGSRFVNVVMLGAVAGALGEPPLDQVLAAAAEVLGGKGTQDGLHSTLEAVAEGYASLATEVAYA